MHIRDMLIGYARISTDDQDLRLRRAALKDAGCKRTFEEKIAGARRDRPELTRRIDQLRDDDMVVVTRLDRLARSTRDLLAIAGFERGLIHRRTSSGRVAAKARGVRFGRPPRLTPDRVALGGRLVREGTSLREAARLLDCHHDTLYRALTAATLTV